MNTIYFKERNEADNHKRFGKRYHKLMSYLQCGFGLELGEYDPTHIFLATWNNAQIINGVSCLHPFCASDAYINPKES